MAINNGEQGISVRNKLNGLISDVDILKTNPPVYILQGTINLAADFPTPATVQVGWRYVIGADVTDNDATKTNTGQSFLAGVSIVWAADGSWLDLGSNYVTQAQKDKIDLGANFVKHIDLSTPAITPFEGAVVTPDEDGTYTNYGGLVRLDELCNFVYESGSWVKKTTSYDTPNFVTYTVGDLTKELSGGTTIGDVLSAFKNVTLIGVDPLFDYKLRYIQRNELNRWQIVLSKFNGSIWEDIYNVGIVGLIEELNKPTRWDASDGKVRLVADISWYKLSDGFAKNIEYDYVNTAPIMTIDKRCMQQTIALNQAVDFKNAMSARFGRDVYPCFVRLNTNNDIDNVIGTTGATPYTSILASFKYLKIEGSDNTCKHKVTYMERNELNRWRIIISKFDGANWVRVYDKAITGLIENGVGVTRWDETVGSIRLIADIEWSYINDGFGAMLFGEAIDPPFIFNQDNFIEKVGTSYDQSLNTTDSVEFAGAKLGAFSANLPTGAGSPPVGVEVGDAWIDTSASNVIKVRLL